MMFWTIIVLSTSYSPEKSSAEASSCTSVRHPRSSRSLLFYCLNKQTLWIMAVIFESICLTGIYFKHSCTLVPPWGSSSSSSGCLDLPRPSCSDLGHECLTCSLHRKFPLEHKPPTLPIEPPGPQTTQTNNEGITECLYWEWYFCSPFNCTWLDLH